MKAGDARTIVAFDYGLRRIGIAVGNTLTSTAAPLETVRARDGEADWPAIAAILRSYAPDICLVGIPYNMDGSETHLTPKVREFAARLAEIGRAEVVLVDERLSSRAAQEVLRERRETGQLKHRVRNGDVDRMAATILLQQWLHECASHDERTPAGGMRGPGDAQ